MARWKTLVLSAILPLIAILVAVIIQHPDQAIDYPELGKTIHQLIELRGFESETHYIDSHQNGYILQAVRIVNPFVSNRSTLKPILLHHGYQCSGSAWLVASNGTLRTDGSYWEESVMSKEGKDIGNTLAFVLASQGYDVWLANARGNIYSTNHSTLSVHEVEYWQFSLDEIIKHDLPAVIEYIRVQTSRENISYIGHSQGNLMMFGLLSTQPQFADIVKPFIALSPVAFFTNLSTPIKKLEPDPQWFLKQFPKGGIVSNGFRKLGIPKLCTNPWFQRNFCYWLYYGLVGSSSENVDFKRLPIYLDNSLHGSSSRNFAHLLQQRAGLVHYDHGDPEINLLHYNQTTPPHYDFSLINSSHIAVFYAQNDWFLPPENVQRLKDNLNVKFTHENLIQDHSWGHMELMWGKQVGKHVNREILKILEKYLN